MFFSLVRWGNQKQIQHILSTGFAINEYYTLAKIESRRGCCKISHPSFLYPVFGRFTYTQSALNGQSPSISDRMFVNSRTLDKKNDG